MMKRRHLWWPVLGLPLLLSATLQAQEPRPGERPRRGGPQRYSLEQATSDRAQLHTIAFSALAFLSGDFAHDTFLPPGKVSDYFGFQYLRDVDVAQAGHSTSFLTRIAHNVLALLDEAQLGQLVSLARTQQKDIAAFAEMRLPLMQAFRRQLDAANAGSVRALDAAAVQAHSARLYALDGELAFQRARVMASVLGSLNAAQRAQLTRLRFGDSGTWPDVPAPPVRRTLDHEQDVALMTYASEMFSWHAGSLAADTYFCPERHGMYFGGFGLKTAPAMGKKDYAISTALTGDSGEAFLELLTPQQRGHITELLELQRSALAEIVVLRGQIATELRRFLQGQSADHDKVIQWSRRYGELDGQLSFLYARAFAAVARTLGAAQWQQIRALRQDDARAPKGPFLYSTPLQRPIPDGADKFMLSQRP